MDAVASVTADRELLLVELVDRAGAAVGACPVGEAHTEHGRLHRAFSVLLYDTDGRVLLQRRAAVKTRFALRWSNTCCGHPAPGQDIAGAARTRLAEELGIGAAQTTPLTEAGAFYYRATDPTAPYVEEEWDHVLAGRLTSGSLAPAASEVSQVRWVFPSQLATEIEARPDEFTPWLGRVLGIAGTLNMEGVRP